MNQTLTERIIRACRPIRSAKPIRITRLFLFLAALSLFGCAGVPHPPKSTAGAAGEELNERQRKLVQGAYELKGVKKLIVNGRTFRMDCTGAVAALYWYAGIDLLGPLAAYRGNGVQRLYRYMEDEQLLIPSDSPGALRVDLGPSQSDSLFAPRSPLPGDIIFWDNTYDQDGDGLADDEFTHTGVVVSVDSDGAVVYYHHNYRRGIVLERMHITEPNIHKRTEGGPEKSGELINSPMRMRGSPNFDLWLAGQLVRAYGRAWRLEPAR
jgi:hypothetical protein